ncbi:chorismate lyase [bacterium endosymbiont of Escarpia laminata]|nr:MAG: chorismate lyase [bacterium endosymbiont of Escarpia laminata]
MQKHAPEKSVLEPSWSGWRQLRFSSVPKGVLSWLRDEGSLTRRVIQACAGDFRVRVLHQGWGTPLYSEGQVLRLRRGETTLVREVELLCDETPWVFARTLIPATSLKGPARRLTLLGNKPLGAVLFSDPQVRRGITQVARLQPRHPLFAAATSHLAHPPVELWGRRTLFYIAGRPLLVNEIFLPDIPRDEGR